MIRIDINDNSRLALAEQVTLLTLPRARRERILGRIGREVIRSSRKHARAQQEPGGKAWAPRKKKGRKRSGKMITGLPRLMTITEMGQGHVTMGWKNRLTGHLAKRHQDGVPEPMTAGKVRRQRGQPDYNGPATRQQAKALRELGYRIPAARKGRTKAPSLKWITENMSLGQAGIIIRSMRGEKSKQKWNIDVAARPFAAIDMDQAVSIVHQELTRG